jgi:hypothetical protein
VNSEVGRGTQMVREIVEGWIDWCDNKLNRWGDWSRVKGWVGRVKIGVDVWMRRQKRSCDLSDGR